MRGKSRLLPVQWNNKTIFIKSWNKSYILLHKTHKMHKNRISSTSNRVIYPSNRTLNSSQISFSALFFLLCVDDLRRIIIYTRESNEFFFAKRQQMQAREIKCEISERITRKIHEWKWKLWVLRATSVGSGRSKLASSMCFEKLYIFLLFCDFFSVWFAAFDSCNMKCVVSLSVQVSHSQREHSPFSLSGRDRDILRSLFSVLFLLSCWFLCVLLFYVYTIK